MLVGWRRTGRTQCKHCDVVKIGCEREREVWDVVGDDDGLIRIGSIWW